MIGAITGDVIGSVHEGTPAKDKNFRLFVPGSTFTDDTILTVAVASAIRNRVDYGVSIRQWGRRYPGAGYGGKRSRIPPPAYPFIATLKRTIKSAVAFRGQVSVNSGSTTARSGRR